MPLKMTSVTVPTHVSAPQAYRLQQFTAPVVILGLGIVFWPPIRGIAHLWLTESLYSASVLVPVISVAIAYLKRRRVLRHEPSAVGLLLVLISVATTICLDVTQLGFYSVRPALLVVAISGVVVVGWGWWALRTLAFPILFLLFLVPVPPSMMARLDYPLQELCARVTTITAGWAGIQVHRTGAMLLFADPRLGIDIVPACNGTRSVLAMVMTAVVYAYLVRGRWYKKAAIVAAAVPLAYAANFLRLFGITSFVSWAGPAYVNCEPVWDHVLGFLLFALAVVMLFVWARVLKCHQLREIG